MTGIHDLFPDGQAVDKESLRRGLAGPVINLQGFGASPDGATDISSAFENAIASADAGSTLLLPPGRYALRKPVIVAKRGLRLSCVDAVIDATTLDGSGFNAERHGSPLAPAFLVTGEDVSFVGGLLCTDVLMSEATVGGIVLSGAKRCVISGTRITGAFNVAIWPGGGSEDVTIERCHIEGGYQNIVLGFISRKWPQITRAVVRDVTSLRSHYHGILAHGYVRDLQISGGSIGQTAATALRCLHVRKT